MDIVQWCLNIRIHEDHEMLTSLHTYPIETHDDIFRKTMHDIDLCKQNIRHYRSICAVFYPKQHMYAPLAQYIHTLGVLLSSAQRHLKMRDVYGAHWCLREIERINKPIIGW